MLSTFSDSLVPWIWAAGAIHLILVAANVFLPGILDYRGNLARMQPIIRQIFVVHSIYLVLILLIFSCACLFFATDLAGASGLGRFLCAVMAFFWMLRIPLQLFYYDPELRRQRRFADVAYTMAVAFLAIVFTTAFFKGN
jgi:hypothetical protein